jgi:iron complex transport system permease protein
MNETPLHGIRWIRVMTVYIALVVVVLCVAPWFGPTRVSPGSVISESLGRSPATVQSIIFYQQRVPRVLLGLCVGAALGLAGAAFQALLRNPLATPYTLGVASAGTLAASVSIIWPALAVSFGPFSSTHLFALGGSACAAAFIFLLSRYTKSLSTSFIILAGVAVNLFCGSALLFMRFLADPRHLVAIDRWVMGGLITVDYWEIGSVGLFLVAGGGIILYHSHAVNQLLFGYEIAGSRGINTKRLFLLIMSGGVLLTTGAVAAAGPIGFIGLVIPHAVRMISGPDQRIVFPASALMAGAVLVLCDTVARTCVAPTEIPVGVITACCGAPIFMVLLIRSYSRRRQ